MGVKASSFNQTENSKVKNVDMFLEIQEQFQNNAFTLVENNILLQIKLLKNKLTQKPHSKELRKKLIKYKTFLIEMIEQEPLKLLPKVNKP